MQFKAAMFDFDGTITELGQYSPEREICAALVELAQKMPIAFCTGRQLESFERRGLANLLEEINPEQRSAFLKNLYLIAENGAMGYDFNPNTEKFERFYMVDWPEDFLPKQKLKKILAEKIKDYGQVYDDAHEVVVVMRTNLHDVEDRDVKAVCELSDKIYEIALKELTKLSVDFMDHLHIGNSGIGVVICPANGDKDRGIREFGKYLEKNRNIKFDPKFRGIIAVGDNPLPGGNDHYFLNGEVGTPFTVGGKVEESAFPKPVIDIFGNRLGNVQGTLYLIRNVLLTNTSDIY